MNKQYATPSINVMVWEQKNVFLASSLEDAATNAEDNVIGWSE